MQPLFTFHANASKRPRAVVAAAVGVCKTQVCKNTPRGEKVECTGTLERSLNKSERNADGLTPASATGSA